MGKNPSALYIERIAEGVIDRSAIPEIIPFTPAEVRFDPNKVTFDKYSHRNYLLSDSHLSCEGVVWQVPQMVQIFNQFSEILSTVFHLSLDVIHAEYRDVEGTGVEWLRFFNQFSSVQALHVGWRFAGHVAHALENIAGKMAAEVWPTLDLIC